MAWRMLRTAADDGPVGARFPINEPDSLADPAGLDAAIAKAFRAAGRPVPGQRLREPDR